MENAIKFQTPTQVDRSLAKMTWIDKMEILQMDIDSVLG